MNNRKTGHHGLWESPRATRGARCLHARARPRGHTTMVVAWSPLRAVVTPHGPTVVALATMVFSPSSPPFEIQHA